MRNLFCQQLKGLFTSYSWHWGHYFPYFYFSQFSLVQQIPESGGVGGAAKLGEETPGEQKLNIKLFEEKRTET